MTVGIDVGLDVHVKNQDTGDAPNSRDFPAGGEILLAGHFDPRMLLPLFSAESAGQLAGLHGPPGVPIHHLATGFARRGIKTTVLGGLHNCPDLYVRGEPLSVALYNKRGTRAFTLTGYRREREAILARFRQIRPSIVHGHWTMEAARAVVDWDGPRILTIHDAVYEYARLSWRWHPGSIAYWSRWVANTLTVLNRVDHLIAVSPFVETYLRLRHHFRGEIRVIPNGIPPLPPEIRPIQKYPKTKQITFGCYGGTDRLKNIKSAIEAFLIARKEVPESRLIIFGAGWERLRYQYHPDLIEMRGHLSHIEFLRSLATEVDIWIHPSRIEAHPITICEAIQAGCPLIAGRASGGVAWTLDYGAAGLLVDIGDPARIAEAMTALARDRSRGMALVSYGQEMIRQRFSPDRIVDMHLNYYHDVIRQWKDNRRERE